MNGGVMKKKQKNVYLTEKALQKLELLKQINCMDYSMIVELLIKKQKKLQLL